MEASQSNPIIAQEPSLFTIKIQVLKILIIDDDCDDMDILKSLINEFSPQSHLFCFDKPKDAYQFLDALKDDELPNLIIIDFKMPPMSGVEVLVRLKEHRRFNNVPKIIYSGLLSPADKAKCVEAGATAYLQKTFDYHDFKEKIAEILSHCK